MRSGVQPSFRAGRGRGAESGPAERAGSIKDSVSCVETSGTAGRGLGWGWRMPRSSVAASAAVFMVCFMGGLAGNFLLHRVCM